MVDYPIFGDTSGTLSGTARGHGQILVGPDVPDGGPGADMYGDALVITDSARGGSDAIFGPGLPGGGGTFAFLHGDAKTISGFGQGEDDLIVCGSGPRNQAYGDAEQMTDNAHGGDDGIFGAAGAGNFNFLNGDAGGMRGNSVGGNDIIMAGNGAGNDIFGDATLLTDNSHGGNDVINAYGARVFGDGEFLRANAHGGNDLILNLSSASAKMFGDAGSAEDTAVCGNDTLVSGAGNDLMFGDAQTIDDGVTTGADTFVFLPGSGQDTIGDFQSGKDHIDLKPYALAGVHGLGDIGISSAAGATLLALPGGNTIMVDGSTPVTTDFLFA